MDVDSLHVCESGERSCIVNGIIMLHALRDDLSSLSQLVLQAPG